MSRRPALAAIALGLGTALGVAIVRVGGSEPCRPGDARPAAPTEPARRDDLVAPGPRHAPVPGHPGGAAATREFEAITRSFETLAGLPSGDPAIEFGHRLEAAISPENAVAYVDALLSTDSPVVERVAHAALARAGDRASFEELLRRHSGTSLARRGRILALFEDVRTTAAVETLVSAIEADTSEKRSPLLVSAMRGLASVATPESIAYLIGQLSTPNEAFAWIALEAVRTPQGRELIRAAARGNKDSAGLPADRLANLARIADEPAPAEGPAPR
jgi:hypothetical protein